MNSLFLNGEHDLDVYCVAVSDKEKPYVFKLLSDIRNIGLAADMGFCDKGLKGQMKDANRYEAFYTVIIGEDEIKGGYAVVKDLENSTQEKVKFDFVSRYLRAGVDGLLDYYRDGCIC